MNQFVCEFCTNRDYGNLGKINPPNLAQKQENLNQCTTRDISCPSKSHLFRVVRQLRFPYFYFFWCILTDPLPVWSDPLGGLICYPFPFFPEVAPRYRNHHLCLLQPIIPVWIIDALIDSMTFTPQEQGQHI